MPVPSTPLSEKDVRVFSPPWELLCLQAFLKSHTRHLATLVDCRLYADVEADLAAAVQAVDDPHVAVVNTVSHALGQAVAVLAIIRRHFPGVKTALCGEFPSQFPTYAADMQWVDYSLAGDPEPILRNLLDYMDVEQRLQRTPGLLYAGRRDGRPYWLPRLHGLSIPDWKDVSLQGYQAQSPGRYLQADVAISRGHTRVPADRAFGSAHEPLRVWPPARIARNLPQCAHVGIKHVHLSDPPGVWTPQQLDEWCLELKHTGNTQPWSLNLLPTMLSQHTVEEMASNACERVDFIFPSCDESLLMKYGCILDPRHLAETVAQLQDAGISIHAHFWFGGPEEHAGEHQRVLKLIRSLNYPPATLHPFPFCMDSPLYEEMDSQGKVTQLEEWIRWARDPWISDRPVPLWGGRQAVELIEAEFQAVRRGASRSPMRLVNKLTEKMRHGNLIRTLEDKALSLLPSPTPPDG